MKTVSLEPRRSNKNVLVGTAWYPGPRAGYNRRREARGRRETGQTERSRAQFTPRENMSVSTLIASQTEATLGGLMDDRVIGQVLQNLEFGGRG